MNVFAEAHLLFLVGSFAVLTVAGALAAMKELFPKDRDAV